MSFAPYISVQQFRSGSWPFICGLILGLWSSLAAAGPASAKPEPLPPAVQLRINEAIVQGVQYLKRRQFTPGHWGASEGGGHEVAYAALPALTLLECGLPAKHSVIEKAANYVREHVDSLGSTYDLALAVLFLDKLGKSEDRALIQTLVLRLVAGQTVTGGWTYGCPVLTPADSKALLAILHNRRAVLSDTVKGLPILQNVESPIPDNPPGTDNSNTHFGLLAVWAGQRYDVPMKRTMFLIVKRFRSSQNSDGGWGYEYKKGGGAAESPPMICAGLLGLAIGEGLIQDLRAKQKAPPKAAGKLVQEQAIKKGLDALGKYVSAPVNRLENVPLGNLYFMWGLERVGMLYDLKAIGEKDWYRWGAEMLVANQRADGNWEGGGYPGESPPINTSLALLFLNRSNLTGDLTKKIMGEDRDPVNLMMLPFKCQPGVVIACSSVSPIHLLPFFFMRHEGPPKPAPVVAAAPAPVAPVVPAPMANNNPPPAAPVSGPATQPAPAAPTVAQPAPVAAPMAASTPVPSSNTAAGGSVTPAPADNNSGKGRSTMFLAIGIGAAAILLLAGGLFLIFFRRDSKPTVAKSKLQSKNKANGMKKGQASSKNGNSSPASNKRNKTV